MFSQIDYHYSNVFCAMVAECDLFVEVKLLQINCSIKLSYWVIEQLLN